METGLIDQRIRKAFSNAADDYDTLTSLHRSIGGQLAEKIVNISQRQTILDVGCGTGWMTNQLSVCLPESTVIGMDFASGMVKKTCENYDELLVLQSDVHQLPFKNDIFDTIVSNLAFQWMEDLQSSLKECHRALKGNGNIAMTLFGYETFSELFENLEKTSAKYDENKNLTFNRLANGEQIYLALQQAGFNNIGIARQLVKVHFDDMFGLIKWIKDIGANCLGNNSYLGRKFLEKANQNYSENYKDESGVYATLEVIWVEARK